MLTVIGYVKFKNSLKKYLVSCSICKKDKELNNSGTYLISKAHLLSGRVPCGCSLRVVRNEYQSKILISRYIENKGISFKGFHEEFKGKQTKLILSCPIHGEWRNTTINNLFLGGGCPECGLVKFNKSRKISDIDFIQDFYDSGLFLENTIFCKDSNNRWKYKCPKCSNDEYVKEGLCSGIFERESCGLKYGERACRCTKNYNWTREQREYQINKLIKEKSLPYQFTRWLDGRYKNYKSKFEYSCGKHGRQETNTDNFLRGKFCPECSGDRQIYAYINVVYDEDLPVALKFGITNNLENRIYRQNKINLFEMENIYRYRFPSSDLCKRAERECKKRFEKSWLTIRELKDGSTETTHIKNLEEILKIYVDCKGIRV